ncbi:hypothetical protein B0H17DRAFT_1231565 [Mycena rosella]|uniref:BTB domain-containing protein n=1 Tax=Mycena rosella TaxID=1033263 RepID=A0AAD7GRI6_MYCRO|nr:hypothetical protein B0H17DRAFT_1231565 [Mycena rosella]
MPAKHQQAGDGKRPMIIPSGVRPTREEDLVFVACSDDADQQQGAVRSFAKDGKFYFDDGNCILSVGNTLFKPKWGTHGLHSSLQQSWSKRGSNRPGNADLTQLRVFCGYTYSNPFALRSEEISGKDLQKLIDTIRFTHHYGLKSLYNWAEATFIDVASQNKAVALKRCSVVLYIELLDLDTLNELPILRALDASEVAKDHTLQGIAYYVQLKEFDTAKDTVDFSSVVLPDHHKLRVLQGSRSLSLLWQTTIASAPPLAKYGPLCKHSTAERNCEARTGRAVQLTKIKQGDSVCPAVTRASTRAVQDVIRALNIGIAEHFLGPAHHAV